MSNLNMGVYKRLSWIVILPYFFIFYVIPLILMSILGPHRNFLNEGNIFILFMVITWTAFFVYVFSKLQVRLPIKTFSYLPNIFEKNLFTILFALCVLPAAIKFNLDFGAGFRYSGEELSSSGALPQIITLYKSFFAGFVVYSFFKSMRGSNFSLKFRLSLFLHTFNWILCANGAVDIFWIITALLIVFKGSNSLNIFTSTVVNSSLLKRFVLIIVSATAVSGVIFFGFANKVGFDAAYEIFANEFFSRVIYYLYYRLSVFLSSLDLILAKGINIDFYLQAASIEIELFLYRLGVIFQFNFPRPSIEGINRLNYLLLYKDPSLDRAGATPGPLATFAYLPIFPLNFIIGALYISIIRNTFLSITLITIDRTVTIFSLLMFAIICFAFFHNPLSSFIKIGPELFKTLFLIYVFGAIFKSMKRNGVV